MENRGLCGTPSSGWAEPLVGRCSLESRAEKVPHNSQALEEGEDRVGRTIASWLVVGRSDARQGLLFHREIRMEVDLHGAQIFMTQPERDRCEIDVMTQEGHGAGVTKGVNTGSLDGKRAAASRRRLRVLDH